jgi:hypothetical protein
MAGSNKVGDFKEDDEDELQSDALSDFGMHDTKKSIGEGTSPEMPVSTFNRASRTLSSQPLYIDPHPRSYRR